MSKENADQLNWISQRKECAPVHGGAVGATTECAGERERDTGVLYAAEKRGNKETYGTYS